MIAVQLRSARAAGMTRAFIALALALLAAPSLAQQPAPAVQLNDDQRTLLHCSATFALVSGRQRAGDKDALAFPDVSQRGREYFVRALVQLMDDAGLDHDAVARLVQDEAARLQDSPDLLKGMPACLASLQASGL
jgi:parvulin-like peptidyl-prolyl isomerase